MEQTLFSNDLKVLLIEDDNDTRDILAFFLKELGISEITGVANGLEGLNFINYNQNWRGIIMCDWNMPAMSGAAFYREVKKIHHDIPFIMVTGRNDEDSVQFAKDQGVYAYLLKPVTIEELSRKLNKVSHAHARFLGLPIAHIDNTIEKHNHLAVATN